MLRLVFFLSCWQNWEQCQYIAVPYLSGIIAEIQISIQRSSGGLLTRAVWTMEGGEGDKMATNSFLLSLNHSTLTLNLPKEGCQKCRKKCGLLPNLPWPHPPVWSFATVTVFMHSHATAHSRCHAFSISNLSLFPLEFKRMTRSLWSALHPESSDTPPAFLYLAECDARLVPQISQ